VKYRIPLPRITEGPCCARAPPASIASNNVNHCVTRVTPHGLCDRIGPGAPDSCLPRRIACGARLWSRTVAPDPIPERYQLVRSAMRAPACVSSEYSFDRLWAQLRRSRGLRSELAWYLLCAQPPRLATASRGRHWRWLTQTAFRAENAREARL